MSFTASAALQTALYTQLTSDDAFMTLVQGAIFDAPPSGELPEIFVQVGEENVADLSSITSRAARFDLRVQVSSSVPGFAKSKEVAARICQLLDGAPLTLSSGRLRYLRCGKISSRFSNNRSRRITTLNFRAYVDE